MAESQSGSVCFNCRNASAVTHRTAAAGLVAPCLPCVMPILTAAQLLQSEFCLLV